jgi:predicted DNA-binding transcriptional regulator YafY
MRDDFRSFRLDRMREMRLLRERFHDEAGRTLEDYLSRQGDHEW